MILNLYKRFLSDCISDILVVVKIWPPPRLLPPLCIVWVKLNNENIKSNTSIIHPLIHTIRSCHLSLSLSLSLHPLHSISTIISLIPPPFLLYPALSLLSLVRSSLLSLLFILFNIYITQICAYRETTWMRITLFY